ncbi:hypothetical protein FS842_001964 [Serendipita sp. 407]|nr:hypothetical protein FS842_001964 [Serendipita sp. 407]
MSTSPNASLATRRSRSTTRSSRFQVYSLPNTPVTARRRRRGQGSQNDVSLAPPTVEQEEHDDASDFAVCLVCYANEDVQHARHGHSHGVHRCSTRSSRHRHPVINTHTSDIDAMLHFADQPDLRVFSPTEW